MPFAIAAPSRRSRAGERFRPKVVLLVLMFSLTKTWAQSSMNPQERHIATAAELLAAITDRTVSEIVVQTNLTALPTFRLAPGQRLRGAGPGVALHFAGVDPVS
jgi:hypothetical protein